MKRNLIILFLLSLFNGLTYAQTDSQNNEYIGDNFSLEGALNVFKNSSNIEEFEKEINQENQNVNNLDLDNNGETDYISVESMKEGDNHNIILYTYLLENERQDIAVIEIEKTGKEDALLQIIGDEALYKENIIVEPIDMTEPSEKGQGTYIENAKPRIVVNVWFWKPIRFIYGPGYSVWVSPYRWHFYPKWWKPWKPIRYHVFYTKTAPQRVVYHRTTVHRIKYAHAIYHPHRKTSTTIIKHGKNTTVVHKNRKGNVKVVKTKRKAHKK